MSNYTQLQEVLSDIFELNKADLDFGIYRIMNQKRKEINQFLTVDLEKDIKAALSNTTSNDQVELEQALKKIEKDCESVGVVKEDNAKYILAKEQLDNYQNTEAMEQEVFSHLANFFRRYYKDGDFISMRRYKKDVYAIPYEGEEVKLHWANHDQYYIKSSENFKNYAFLLDNGKKINFNLKEATTEQNNNKSQGDAERRFAIYTELPVEEIDGELSINFIYETFPKSTKQDVLLAEALESITQNTPEIYKGIFTLMPTEKNKSRTLVEKHLTDFVSRNSFDYFIHKDLGGFLQRELDFYIKNEVLYIDDLNEKQTEFFTAQLSKIKALKAVALKIITFLASIENFQKKLWLKKKMVIRTDYLITLDRIAPEFYDDILANEKQKAEWKMLFDVEINSVEELTFEQFLVIDTQFFSEEFKDKFLGTFENLDESINGLLINSENFQALNLLQEKYIEKIKTIYIDPPYNTGDDGFIYKDNLSHSSWMTFMSERNMLSRELLSENGSFFCQINDKEYNNLSLMCNSLYGIENRIQSVTVKTATPAGFKVVNPGPVDVSESILFYTKEKKNYKFKKIFVESDYVKDYKYYINNVEDNICDWNIENIKDVVLKDFGYTSEKDFKQFYGKETASVVLDLGISNFALNNAEKVFATYGPHKPTGRLKELIEFSKENKNELVFEERDGMSPYILLNGRLLAFYSNKLKSIDNKNVPTELLTDIWVDISWDSLSSEGKITFKNGKKPEKLLKRIFEINDLKEKDIVLDYFVGSGTTVASALKSNQMSIGVELGSYFHERTIKRIKYTLNGEQGGISKILKWKGGGFIKYIILESYEDTLNNLFLEPTEAQQQIDFTERASREYLLHYMLDVESRDQLFNIEMFAKPFDYQLKITENNELVPTKVDLVETFNYLIGLYVSKVQRVKDIKVIEGVTREGLKTLVIWRDTETTTHDEVLKLVKRFYDSQRTQEFQQIYINGDHHLENLRQDGDQFKIKLIEDTFFKKMFNGTEL